MGLKYREDTRRTSVLRVFLLLATCSGGSHLTSDMILTHLTHRVTMFQKNQVVSRFTSTITGNIKES